MADSARWARRSEGSAEPGIEHDNALPVGLITTGEVLEREHLQHYLQIVTDGPVPFA